jgi:preprotein translocase subunit SecB
MGQQTTNASFQLESVTFPQLSFTKPEGDDHSYALAFQVSGLFDALTHRFSLTMLNQARQEEIKFLELELTGVFVFDGEDGNVPDYFYKNALGILFPYLRSMVSTITSQAGWTPMILPLLNLSQLEAELRANTKNR